MTADREREIFEERARALARPREATRTAEGTRYAVFERAGVRYAIDQRDVRSVERAREPTPLPGTAAYWLGLSSLHGELLPLIELPALLGNDLAAPEEVEQGEDAGRLVLVLGGERRELGIVIDVLHDVTVMTVELRAPASDDAALVSGTSRDGVRIVRADALLRDPRLFLKADATTES